MRFLSLFAGIGGFDLGLERAGMECVGQVEIDPFCQKVLAKHWPDVKRMTDIRDVKSDEFGPIDLICGGFPCQDISLAGKGKGLTGKRSGLWFEYARIIGEVGPRWVIIENVPALRSRGFVTVLQNLSALGYDAEWHCIPASHVGAPHRRDRIWIVAFPLGTRTGDKSRTSSLFGRNAARKGPETVRQDDRTPLPSGDNSTSPTMAEKNANARRSSQGSGSEQGARLGCSGEIEYVADTPRLFTGRQEQRPERQRIGTGSKPVVLADTPGKQRGVRSTKKTREHQTPQEPTGRCDSATPDTYSEPTLGTSITRQERPAWLSEPDVDRVAHGVPSRVDRLKCLGNAVVPQVVEMIGRAIMESEKAT